MDNLDLGDWINDDAAFEQAWAVEAGEPNEEELSLSTSQYQYIEGFAHYKQIAMLLGVFYHAVHGEELLSVAKISPDDGENNIFPESKISFHLDAR